MRWTKCLKCFDTINCSASVALVLSRVTIGLRVIIWLTGVECGSRPSAVTYEAVFSTWNTAGKRERKRTRNARSFAVKIPLNPSSSSTTRTQSVRFAAHNWLASATDMFSGTVKAGEGLSAATVPLAAASFPPLCFLPD